MKERRISIELVARDVTQLQQELEYVKTLNGVDTLNVPDIRRYPMRSWEGCAQALGVFRRRIPHVRACDFDSQSLPRLLKVLEEACIEEVLVVTGDESEQGNSGYDALTLLSELRRERPHWTLYAALDPWRSTVAAELEYAEQKLRAGADGFFTQPMFALSQFQNWEKHLSGLPVFWGVAPIVSERSMSYWARQNKVQFPRGFQPDLKWQKELASDVLDWSKENSQHLYFMPVKVDVKTYFDGLL